MSDIIQLLPDSVANQIAAGEVIQRPASAVKELIENAIDAGATDIIINIKDAGKTLIQITDNGCGMSPTDARMAFERHATSKITNANDLFCIRTMGFRGEALASIAAIADVELKTKRIEDEIGTLIHLVASETISQEPIATNIHGTTFLIKNLFFNVPARRKFLKSNNTELKHIINEINRAALPNPQVKIVFINNGNIIYDLPKTNLRKRIIDIFTKGLNQSLVNVDEVTSLVTIKGFIGQPKFAKKTMGEQFFFVNGRYMKHYYFHKAVMVSYEKLLPKDVYPSYFLYLEIDPSQIDINVHPTKTEIKFENEQAIWQIINAAVRESLGKNNIVPSIDFDQSGNIDIPIAKGSNENVSFPKISIDPTYNPFEENTNKSSSVNFQKEKDSNLQHWEKLFESVDRTNNQPEIAFKNTTEKEDDESSINENNRFLQIKNKYILTPIKSGLMIIDQRRAHERILFENFLSVIHSDTIVCQQQLFPQTMELGASDATLLKSILADLHTLGFDIREFGNNSFVINGTPGILEVSSPITIVEKLLEEYKTTSVETKDKVREQLAHALSKASALNYNTHLKTDEINHLVDRLFACKTPNFTPDGKKVIDIISSEEFDKKFNK